MDKTQIFSEIVHENELEEFAKKMSFYLKERIWLIEGDLGAGKTTLIKNICQTIGVKDHITSPTFSIVNHYSTSLDTEVYHFDLFRIENKEELLEIGITELLSSGNYCLIEWPNLVLSFIETSFLKIHIYFLNSNQRKFVVYKYK